MQNLTFSSFFARLIYFRVAVQENSSQRGGFSTLVFRTYIKMYYRISSRIFELIFLFKILLFSPIPAMISNQIFF